MKKCIICKTLKEFKFFYKDKCRIDGYAIDCKECNNNRKRKHGRTKKGVVMNIFSTQKRSSKKRSHNPPSYTKQDLREWIFSQPLFHKLYDKWVDSGYLKYLKPSIDRKDDNIGYTIDNIQLMKWCENKQKSHDNMRSGKLKHGTNPQKKVLQFTKNNIFIKEYVSLNEASRQTAVFVSNISSCCREKYNTAGGFIW